MIEMIKALIKAFNDSFELEPEIVEVDGEEVVTSLKIKDVKGDCSEFVEQLFDMLGKVVEGSSEYELIYDEDGKLDLAKKVVEVKYIKE